MYPSTGAGSSDPVVFAPLGDDASPHPYFVSLFLFVSCAAAAPAAASYLSPPFIPH